MKELLPLAVKYVEEMAHDSEKIKHFVTVKELLNLNWVPLDVIDGAYFTLVNTKELVPIEQLGQEEKQRLWNLACKWVEGTREHRMRCTRVIYFIEQLQDKKVEQ